MNKSHLILTLVFCLLVSQQSTQAAIINTTPTPTAVTTSTLTTTATVGSTGSGANLASVGVSAASKPVVGASVGVATQPAFSFDFGSMFDRSSAQSAVTQTKASWDNFFT